MDICVYKLCTRIGLLYTHLVSTYVIYIYLELTRANSVHHITNQYQCLKMTLLKYYCRLKDFTVGRTVGQCFILTGAGRNHRTDSRVAVV